jgi:hypothetical protein
VSGLFRDQDEVDQAPAQEGAAPGRFRYQDVNSEIPYTPAINPEDRTYLGNPIPDFTGGFSATFSYKNFELQLYGYAVVGNEIYNLKRRTTDFFNTTGSAINNNIENSWTFDNPNSNIPLFENAQNFSTNTQSSSYYIEDGSYFRMENITLAYNFGPSLIGRWGFDHFRISASANNLFTITNYSGLDPGVGGNLDYNFGIDGGNYPVNTSWMLGVNVSF